MKIADLIIRDARDRGLTHFFGLPGGGAPLDLMEAGRRYGVQFISVAHESSAALMAGYNGEMKKTAGLALAVKGVGAGNLVGGATNAHFERLPVVCLCECSPTSVRQKDMVQHCDHAGMFSSVAKWQAVLDISAAPAMISHAVAAATSGRPGPVLLNLPSDLGQAECADSLPARRLPTPVAPSAEGLSNFRSLLLNARRPVVIAGKDIIRAGATAELRSFVESIEAAVLVTMEARGVFPESHARWAGVLVGGFGPNIIETDVLGSADLVVMAGVDAMMSHVPWKSGLPVLELATLADYDSMAPAPKIRVDGDLKSALKILSSHKQTGFSTAQIQALRKDVLKRFVRPGHAVLTAQDVIEAVRAALPKDGALFTETGAFVGMLEHLWPVDEPGAYYGTSGGRTMGLMVPAALGARLAQPERPIIGLGADGSMLMRLGELEVFARTGAVVPIVIINDRALGTMKSRQKSRGLPDYGLDLHDVDFAQVARSCGLYGATARTPEELEVALSAAVLADRTTLIDARVDPGPYQDSFATATKAIPAR